MPNKQGLHVDLQLTIEGLEYIDVEEQKEWDIRNASQFGMARSALVESNQVNDEWYEIEGNAYRFNIDEFARPEIDAIAAEPSLKRRGMWIIGLGQGHDLGIVPYAVKKGLRVQLADHSKVACQRGFEVLEPIQQTIDPVDHEPNIHLADILYVILRLLRSRDVLIQIDRVLHHLAPSKRDDVVQALASFLANDPRRRALITTPNRSDNLSHVAEYRSVKEPFDIDDIVTKMSLRSGRDAYVDRSLVFDAFGEKFTAATIKMKELRW